MKKTTWIVVIIIILVVVGIGIYKINQPKKLSGEQIKIGAILPLSGPASFVGEDFRRGMEFAADEFGGDISFQDGKAAPTDSLNAALQLQNSGHKIILSAFRGASLAIASSFKDKEDVIVFSTTATSDRAPIGDFGKNFFAIGAEMISNGAEAGKDAKDKCNIAVALTEQSDAGIDKVTGFSDAIGSEKVAFTEEFPTDKSNFQDLITKIKQYNPDCIFIEVKSNYFANFMNDLIGLGLTPTVYTTSYSVNKDVVQNMTEEQKNLIIFSSTSINPEKDFSNKYFKKYNRHPSDFALVGYEMIKLVVENQKDCEINDNTECLNQNLSKIKDYNSSVGVLNIDTHQEIKLQDNSLYKILGNEFVEVKPKL
jgi:branched-chain amino acid transport system substrate-binding protein